MSYHKIGFLSDQGGNANGIGDYARTLDSSGIPSITMCNNDVKGIADALALIDAGSTTKHVMVHRVARSGMDVPNYSRAPVDAARDYYDLIIPYVHTMVKSHRDKVWVQLGNELDKNRAEWLAEWSMESELLWGSLGYKICVINWSTGEPEPEHWRAPMMLSMLRLAAEKQASFAVGLHEYSLTTDSIAAGNGYLVGRFKDLIAACEENNIGHPSILVTEFGWTLDSIPEQQQALAEIERVAQMYGQYPTLLGAGTWYLGSGFGSIANEVQPLMLPVTQQSLDYVAPPQQDPDPTTPTPTPNPDETFEEYFWRRSIELQTVSLNPAALLQSTAAADGYNIVEGEFWDSYADSVYAAQAAEHLLTGDRRVYITPVPAVGNPWLPPTWFDEPDEEVPDDEIDAYDMANYLLPPDLPSRVVDGVLYGDIVILTNNWGQGNERQQLQKINDYSFVTKNSQYEQRKITAQWIDLVVDTSPDGVNYYKVVGHWLPRHMNIGETYTRTETVRYYRKGDCQQINETTWTTSIKFVDHHAHYVVGASGLTIPDVVELQWLLNGNVEETYWYANHLGLIEWLNRANRHSHIIEVIPFGDQQNNVMETIPCLTSGEPEPSNTSPLFIWPVGNEWHITSGGDGGLFDAPRSKYPGNHEGIDLYAKYNDPIYAVADGVVVWADNRRRSDNTLSAYGNHVIIDHENGYITWSAHLEAMTVRAGDIVIQGNTIGRAGSTGITYPDGTTSSSGVHLHFVVQYIGHGLSGYVVSDVVDPAPLLGV